MLNGSLNTLLIFVLISYFPHVHVYAESKPSAKFDQCMEQVDLGALKILNGRLVPQMKSSGKMLY